jgi:hypothetical protein
VEAKRQHISVSQLKNQLNSDGVSAVHPSVLLQDNIIVASDTNEFGDSQEFPTPSSNALHLAQAGALSQTGAFAPLPTVTSVEESFGQSAAQEAVEAEKGAINAQDSVNQQMHTLVSLAILARGEAVQKVARRQLQEVLVEGVDAVLEGLLAQEVVRGA